MTTVQTDAGRQVEIATVTPDPQTSTASTAVVTGSALDVGAYRSLSYTIVVATNSVDWSVFGANAADYSDEVVVQAAATVAAGAASSYSTTQAPFRYYRVKIIDTSSPSHGVATVRGVGK